MRTARGRSYGKSLLALKVNRLTDAELRQLRSLKRVYDDPTITALWVRRDCQRLVDLGFAKHVSYASVGAFSITPEGIEALGLLS